MEEDHPTTIWSSIPLEEEFLTVKWMEQEYPVGQKFWQLQKVILVLFPLRFLYLFGHEKYHFLVSILALIFVVVNLGLKIGNRTGL